MGCQGGDERGGPCLEKGVSLGSGEVVFGGRQERVFTEGHGVGEPLKLDALGGLRLDGW
jgi:hypothetical protein